MTLTIALTKGELKRKSYPYSRLPGFTVRPFKPKADG